MNEINPAVATRNIWSQFLTKHPWGDFPLGFIVGVALYFTAYELIMRGISPDDYTVRMLTRASYLALIVPVMLCGIVATRFPVLALAGLVGIAATLGYALLNREMWKVMSHIPEG